MLTRRIVMSACALCLAIPSAASASAATDPPKPVGPSGITTTIDPSTIVKAKGPYGMTLATSPKLIKAKGPYGMTLATSPKLTEAKGPYGVTAATYPRLTKATGPFGMTVAANSVKTTTATAHPASASSSDGMNDWRTAAVFEAALLAALALGSAWFLSARRHAPHLGM